jgi:carbon monoxide dehydrogenase subunit G
VQLEHSFSVPVGVDEAWKILLDIERVGACMPGALIDSVEGDDFTGTVKVKLGPINLTYKGHASFVEKDEAARRAVIDARGRDARGNGTAEARVTATLHEAGDTTDVKVRTELDITGKPAQFGRGVMVDVGNKLLGQFADELARTIRGEPPAAKPRPRPAHAAPEPAPQPPAVAPAAESPLTPDPAAVPPATETAAAETAATETAEVETVATVNGHPHRWHKSHEDVEPIDLIKHAGPAVGKRLAPVALALVVLLIAIRRRRSRDG